MTDFGYLSSTFVLGMFTIGLVVLVVRMRVWRSYSPQISSGRYRDEDRAGTVRVPVVGPASTSSILALTYVLVVLGAIAGTIGTLDGSIGVNVLVTGFAIALGGYLAYGICFSSGIPRRLNRISYRLKRTASFRRRPLWSLLIGYATFLAVLLTGGLVVSGLWTVGAGPIGFLITLSVLGLVVARYAMTSAGFSFVPSPHGGRGGSTVRNPRAWFVSTGHESSSGESRFDRGRARPVLRGWLTIATFLGVGAAGTVALWRVGGGAVGFLAGLLVVGALAVGYALAGTW